MSRAAAAPALHAPRRQAGTRATAADGIIGLALWVGLMVAYVVTLAPTVLRSDSGEFHVMPWVLGIAHAPGYPLLTLLGRVAMLLPIGDPAYRVNLLDAAAAAGAACLAYSSVVELVRGWPGRLGGIAAAAALGLGATFWQQSLVGGPRPLVFFFTGLLLWLLFRWGASRAPRDLILLAAAAGLGLAHHLNLTLLLPGLVLYLLARDPRLPTRGRQLGAALLAGLLPLALYLYLPIRSGMEPPLGADNLRNPRELLIYLTAANYQDTVLTNCAGSRLIQLQRYLEFLGLQFGPWLPLGSLIGALATLVLAPLVGLVLIYAFLSNAVFGICSSLAMPDYIVPSYLVAAVWLGLALAWGLAWIRDHAPAAVRGGLFVLVGASIVGLSLIRLATGLPYQSMAGRVADGERARAAMAQVPPKSLVLSDWEAITPLWYAQHVLGLNRATKSALVTAAPVSDTWLIEAEKGLEDRPVALAARVPALGDKYRLLPVGSLFELSEKAIAERSTTAGLQLADRGPRLLGYRLEPSVAAPGERVRLTLYERAGGGRETFQVALRTGGDRPTALPIDAAARQAARGQFEGEVSGETYEFSVPLTTGPGRLPLEISYRSDVRADRQAVWAPFATLQVGPAWRPAVQTPPGSLANFDNQLVLRGGTLGGRTGRDLAVGSVGLAVGRQSPLELELRWLGLRWLDESYTLFVHLLDASGRLVAQQDGLPLGGVYHTYKWVPGQEVVDWYRLELPNGLAAGDFWLEIGAYQSVTTRRLALAQVGEAPTATSFRWGPMRLD